MREAKYLEITEWLATQPLDVKVQHSLDLIKKVVEDFGDEIAVAFSGGKDSLVALHLTLQTKPDVKVVWNNTLVEYPETVKFVRQLAKEWNLNFHETRPKITYWKIVEKHGFPKLRWSDRSNPGGGKPVCCKLLKIRPTEEWCILNNCKAIIDGITFDEARYRRLALFHLGLVHKIKGTHRELIRLTKIHPIGFWKQQDVWEYIRINKLPFNPLYLTHCRVGCLPCTGHKYWRETIAQYNPKLLAFILRKMRELGDPRGSQTTLSEVEENA